MRLAPYVFGSFDMHCVLETNVELTSASRGFRALVGSSVNVPLIFIKEMGSRGHGPMQMIHMERCSYLHTKVGVVGPRPQLSRPRINKQYAYLGPLGIMPVVDCNLYIEV